MGIRQSKRAEMTLMNEGWGQEGSMWKVREFNEGTLTNEVEGGDSGGAIVPFTVE